MEFTFWATGRQKQENGHQFDFQKGMKVTIENKRWEEPALNKVAREDFKLKLKDGKNYTECAEGSRVGSRRIAEGARPSESG